ncbi:LysR family transcriptional regulator [Bermanella marisrubri]|uniref:Transcriptional regulator n=1 Tax=Bermanella marisrubri TaxID=207949 RepID=Q1MXT6_9GAMM|nr:LysR family transcriptional regulator [Bermanella marisrubri]EAT10801.1 Transcriptional regulator [Oceanobacter sp. RED65] [Bermanella marisrubri]QIZ84263.1 LysR family transcriptional regulator [Bermanella marisrubri]
MDRFDLNLLIYLDVLLRERSVTKAAQKLGITQPAMSNGLKRLRELFGDPLLVRTSDGMSATERAIELQPMVRNILANVDSAVQPTGIFDAQTSGRVFRIMVSDYAEATLVPALVKRLRREAPGIILDFLTPSDVTYKDVEQGKVDMAINRFDELPQSFHQKTLWRDGFSCLYNPDNPDLNDLNLQTYLRANHIWVSKTGMGVGTGVNPSKDKAVQLGWVDEALAAAGYKRNISVFTRHYQMPALLAMNNDLVATLPTRVARMQAQAGDLAIVDVPFDVPPFELKMAWSPLLHQNPPHRWMRALITEESEKIAAEYSC